MPAGGLTPDAVVLVATVRALKMNGGVVRADLGAENVPALQAGCANLLAAISKNMRGYGLPVVVAINHFSTDTQIAALDEYARSHGVQAVLCRHWAEGGQGRDLARRRRHDCDTCRFRAALSRRHAAVGQDPDHLQAHLAPRGVEAAPGVRERFEHGSRRAMAICRSAWPRRSIRSRPIRRRWCARRFTDPAARGAAGCGRGFVVAICGDIGDHAGLPREPAALRIGLGRAGQVQGCSDHAGGFPHRAAGDAGGLLGGSFDPHEGHVHITEMALRRWLDRVWWLVSPGNPLKAHGPAPLAGRIAAGAPHHARSACRDHRHRGRAWHAHDRRHHRRAATALPARALCSLDGADNMVQFDR